MKIEDIINIVISIPNAAFFYTPPIYGKSDSYLFLKPKEIVTIKSLRDLDKKLNRIDDLIAKGFSAYSLMNYEAGYLFEKTLYKYLPRNENLIQFFFYEFKNIQKIKSTEIEFDESSGYKVKDFRLNTSNSEFEKSIKKIKSYIEEGDTYQVNYTVKGKFDFEGSYSSLFTNLIFNQSAKYTAVINNNGKIIISVSPEMFFELKGRNIVSKPMKGTAHRGIEYLNDKFIKNDLQTSIKNRAENVMIVDMIRNDLGRISNYGSIKVKNLYEIEKYESVYQMVSTVKSTLNKNVMLSDIIKNFFPCASITGAPKIRTMEIISELEKESRGIYTGSIGLVLEDKSIFNVAIRTIVIDKKTKKGKIGLGSGIVWDSNASEEYEETKLKGRFLSYPINPFGIIETMLVENKKIFLLEEHLKRFQQTADYFLFNYDEKKIRKKLIKIISVLDNKKYKLRATLSKTGLLNYFISEFVDDKNNIKVILSEKRINSQNNFQYFKTTNRNLYDNEYKEYSKQGYFDVIFLNERDEVAEGAITNIFIEKKGMLCTPPISAGILNGVYRKYFIDKYPGIIEKPLHLNDLLNADKIILTNSVRKEVIVEKIIF